MKQPNLFLIGGMRCGSTTIHQMLDQHPEIFMSPVKEPMYYVAEELRRQIAQGADPDPEAVEKLEAVIAAGKYRTTAAYQTLFEDAGREKYLGESSHYLYHGKVAKTIKADCPEARMIVSLRDPVERVFSEYQFYRRTARTNATFEEFLDIGTAFDEAGTFVGMGRSKITKGFYITFLQDWAQAFDIDQIKIILFENLIREPENELHRIFDWLGVDAGFVPRAIHAQMGGTPRGGFYAGFVRNPRLAFLRKRVPRRMKQWIDARAGRLLLRREKLGADHRGFLEDVYRQEAEALTRQFHLDLGPWKWV